MFARFAVRCGTGGVEQGGDVCEVRGEVRYTLNERLGLLYKKLVICIHPIYSFLYSVGFLS